MIFIPGILNTIGLIKEDKMKWECKILIISSEIINIIKLNEEELIKPMN